MYEGLKIANMYTLSETIAAELLSSVTYPMGSTSEDW